VNLLRNDGGGTTLNWGDTNNGFRGQELYAGSSTANGVTTLSNNIDGGAAERRIRAEDNPNSANDAFVFGGQLTNFQRFDVLGWSQGNGNWDTQHGIVAIGSTGSLTTTDWIRARERGYLRVDGTVNAGADLWAENQSKLGGSGQREKKLLAASY
jgi:hypothetical protein